MPLPPAAARRAVPGSASAAMLGLALLGLAACAGGGGSRTAFDPARNSYPEPGPPGDPWRPYIKEASGRFSVPQQWIRAVMHQESGGHEYRDGQPIMSSAGAM
ncbi:MAG: lytic transglycosylase, partial [Gluconacetobacter diazotrophicus]|nr:lytic transglycosylase [Gluconacetobacter diazotrophicus]